MSIPEHIIDELDKLSDRFDLVSLRLAQVNSRIDQIMGTTPLGVSLTLYMETLRKVHYFDTVYSTSGPLGEMLDVGYAAERYEPIPKESLTFRIRRDLIVEQDHRPLKVTRQTVEKALSDEALTPRESVIRDLCLAGF